MEIWINGFEGLYSVTEDGKVFSHIGAKKLLKGGITKGYRHYTLCKNGVKYYLRSCRIVAETFIKNEFNLPQVNHIDGDKLNDTIYNLEWVSEKDNITHAIDTGLKYVHGEDNPNSKRVQCITTGEIFNCIIDGARKYKIGASHISDCCKGKRNHVGKYEWKYI